MIIEPDFLDHWKTKKLIRLLGRPDAPLFVIRLWAFCHQRKKWEFAGITDDHLEAALCWDGQNGQLLDSMKASGFLDGNPLGYVAHGWADANHHLVNNWANGRHGNKGGRPKKRRVKKANANPLGNPLPTQCQPDRLDGNSNIQQPKSNHRDFVDLWMVEYEKHYGYKYSFQSAKDGAAVKELLNIGSPHELIEVARRAWKNAAGFWSKQAATIAGFNSRINEIRGELEQRQQPKPTGFVPPAK